MWSIFFLALFAQDTNSNTGSSSSTDSSASTDSSSSTDSGTTDSGEGSGGPGVARFSNPKSDWKSQENIKIGYTYEAKWTTTSALDKAPDLMTLELEVPFTSPIQYIVIDDKIKKGATSYKWKVSKELTPQKGYRLLLRRSTNPGEERGKTLQAGFGELTPSYSPRFTLYVSKDYSPDPSTENSKLSLQWMPVLLFANLIQ
eukprot:NODE_837_length_3810_cov_0.466990.p2 type:complete len:201 gc:universal NODE_837_length_3810_cov_0.466990:2935-2333(-)